MHYRGTCATVRRAIHTGRLTGEISPYMVRRLLVGKKKHAPTKSIIASLKYMAALNEITRKGHRFFVKETPKAPSSLKTSVQTGTQKVRTTGKLILVTAHNGKCYVTVEAETLDYIIN